MAATADPFELLGLTGSDSTISTEGPRITLSFKEISFKDGARLVFLVVPKAWRVRNGITEEAVQAAGASACLYRQASLSAVSCELCGKVITLEPLKESFSGWVSEIEQGTLPERYQFIARVSCNHVEESNVVLVAELNDMMVASDPFSLLCRAKKKRRVAESPPQTLDCVPALPTAAPARGCGSRRGGGTFLDFVNGAGKDVPPLESLMVTPVPVSLRPKIYVEVHVSRSLIPIDITCSTLTEYCELQVPGKIRSTFSILPGNTVVSVIAYHGRDSTKPDRDYLRYYVEKHGVKFELLSITQAAM
eukprot:m51a1_g10038 hypothetical protein (305) ;mRNA; f:16554-17831